MMRIVEPEILDSLSPEDPEAKRSRADLRFINTMMGGEAWILRELKKLEGVECVVELGAGEGLLSCAIKLAFPAVRVLAVDQVRSTERVNGGVEWIEANVLSEEYSVGPNTVVVANLFLHHLDKEALLTLGTRFLGAKALLFAEPSRSAFALFWARLIYLFVGRVTRYDMVVSIRAGFREGELPELLSNGFEWSETVGFFGGIRSKAE
ncbi:MAG: hypothetical protein ABGY95_08180 [Rubritalea sp.]|uniref:hypothetical protein n=1 Tax=Rubritalea sp. TaxID=2109375 RepID=UPI003242724D